MPSSAAFPKTDANACRVRCVMSCRFAQAKLAPQAIAVFQKANPGVTFSIRDDTSDRLINDLTMGHLDAAILRPAADRRRGKRLLADRTRQSRVRRSSSRTGPDWFCTGLLRGG